MKKMIYLAIQYQAMVPDDMDLMEIERFLREKRKADEFDFSVTIDGYEDENKAEVKFYTDEINATEYYKKL